MLGGKLCLHRVLHLLHVSGCFSAWIRLALGLLVVLLCLLRGRGPGGVQTGCLEPAPTPSCRWHKLGSPVAVSCLGGKGVKPELCEGLGACTVVCEAAGIWLKPEIRKLCNVNWLWRMWWIVIGYFYASGVCF